MRKSTFVRFSINNTSINTGAVVTIYIIKLVNKDNMIFTTTNQLNTLHMHQPSISTFRGLPIDVYSKTPL